MQAANVDRQTDLAPRKSNIELLRIICIFIIILRHYYSQVDWGGFSADNWSWQVLFLQMIAIGGLTANNVFLLISGYFMIEKHVNWKRIVSLVGEMFFYSWVVMLVLYGFGIVPFSSRQLIRGLLPIWFGSNWYVCCYVILCCFLPFLNPFLNSLSKDSYQRLLVVSLLIWSVAYTLKAKTYLGTDFSIDHFVIIYALGGYIKKHPVRLKRGSWKLCFLLSGSLLVLSVLGSSYAGALLGVDFLVKHAVDFALGTNPLDIIVAVALFMWIANSKPFYNRAINILAKSVVGVFLLHHNPLLKKAIWEMMYPNTNYLHSNYLPVHCMIKCTCVFVACFVIDQLRLLTIDKAFGKYLDNRWNLMADKTSSFLLKVKHLCSSAFIGG